MRNKIIYINEKITLVTKDAQKLAMSFCDGMNADIFGKVKIKKSEYEKRVYGSVNAFSSLQAELTSVINETLLLNSDVSSEIERLYSTENTDKTQQLSELLKEIETSQNVCIGISKDCIDEHVRLLDASLSSAFSENKEAVIGISELKGYAHAFFVRSEQYLKQLKQ